MTTLDAAMTAGNAVLAAIPSLNVYRDKVPETIVPPAAWMDLIPDIDYRDSAESDGLFEFEIVLLVSKVLAEHRRKLMPYLERTGSQSVFAAFENNRSLGFSDVHCWITSARSLGAEEVAGYGFFGAALAGQLSIAGA